MTTPLRLDKEGRDMQGPARAGEEGDEYPASLASAPAPAQALDSSAAHALPEIVMKHRVTPLCVLPLLLAGCMSYGPSSLAPGTTVEAARAALGPSSGEFPLPGGGRRLEFARGPYGKHTYMLDFDAGGRLQRWDQVLTEARFNTIQPGMDSQEVLALIGHSREHSVVGWAEKQTVWGYRYETPFCQWFQVGLNAQGKVVGTSYGPDPLCDARDPGGLL
jgi:hypothetical protein